jgi:hypothetical protein
MTKLFLALASLPFIASVAMAGQPVALTDRQMDKVTAGSFDYSTAIIHEDELLSQIVPVNVSIQIHISIPSETVFIPSAGDAVQSTPGG